MNVPQDYIDANVCIVGLGYVGLTLAVGMAEVGYNIVGVERRQDILRVVPLGRAHFSETGLDPRLASQIDNGRLVVRDTIKGPERPTVYVITVGTPLMPGEKRTSLEAIRAVAEMIAGVLRRGDLVILRSTVRVGVTRDVVKPILDRAGVPYGLAFCPERTLEGRALEELRTLPQIVGGIDETSTIRAAQLFSFLTPTTVKVSSLESAELIKLVNNTQRDLNFAFANEVAHICDTVGVSATEVIRAGNMGYARSSVPMPGPVGGPCLEKDPFILAEGVAMRGGEVALGLAGRKLNEELIPISVGKIAEYLRTRGGDAQAPRVAILGLAFKGRPETSDLRGSMVYPLIAALRETIPDVALVGYDPVVHEHEAVTLGIALARTPEEAFAGAHACVFQTNHRAFEGLSLGRLSELMAPNGLIYDYWNQFVRNQHRLANNVRYAGLGDWVGANEGK